MELSLLNVSTTFLDRIAIALLLGSSLAILGIFRRVDDSVSFTILPLIRRVSGMGLVVLIISSTMMLLLRTANMADVALLDTLPFITKVITKSYFGTLWIWRVGILLMVILFWIINPKNVISLGYSVMAIASGVFTFLISASSHAGDEGLLTFENLVNSTHILAACSWGGIIIVYAITLKVLSVRSSKINLVINESTTRLSAIAAIAFVVVIASGLVNSWYRLETLNLLWSTSYGLTLITKLAFVAIMIAIAGANKFYIIPAITQTMHRGTASQESKFADPLQLFSKILLVDAIVFLLVITIAVTLAMQSPMH